MVLTPDLARSAHVYMHVSRESDFDLFESNNLRFFIIACIMMRSLKAEWPGSE